MVYRKYLMIHGQEMDKLNKYGITPENLARNKKNFDEHHIDITEEWKSLPDSVKRPEHRRKLLVAHPYVGDAGTSYPDPNDPRVTTYVTPLLYRGKDDLKSIYPYYDDEWSHTYSPDKDVPRTEQEYLANPRLYELKIAELNMAYIDRFKGTMRYLEPYVIWIGIMRNPWFDDPKVPIGGPLESHRIVFLDTEDFDGESNINYIKQK